MTFYKSRYWISCEIHFQPRAQKSRAPEREVSILAACFQPLLVEGHRYRHHHPGRGVSALWACPSWKASFPAVRLQGPRSLGSCLGIWQWDQIPEGCCFGLTAALIFLGLPVGKWTSLDVDGLVSTSGRWIPDSSSGPSEHHAIVSVTGIIGDWRRQSRHCYGEQGNGD